MGAVLGRRAGEACRPPERLSLLRTFAAAMLLLASGGCVHNLSALRHPGDSYAIATAPPFESLIYAARTDDGVLVVDLGWFGASEALRGALAGVHATPADVTDVFLTHSHRDHIGAWPLLRQARFHLSTTEVELFEGTVLHRDVPSRAGGAVLGEPGPWHGELDLRPFSRDTSFALGRDTLRAFLLPGHTAGSAAYLFRGVLFVGDAFAWNRLTGLRRPARLFSADRRRSRAELRRVIEAARPNGVGWICNAHAKCFAADSALIARLEG